MYSKATIIGNLGRDPELKKTNSGNDMVKLGVAVTQRDKSTQWYNVLLFGKKAEYAVKYLQKGQRVYVDGELSAEQYESRKTGTTQFSLTVMADVIKGMGRKEQEDGPRKERLPYADDEREQIPF
jgi:single-strand DNA-binding protein